jgi:hypothetical protein
MSVSLLTVVVDCRDPRRQAEFWAQTPTYKVSQRNPGASYGDKLAGHEAILLVTVRQDRIRRVATSGRESPSGHCSRWEPAYPGRSWTTIVAV